jgi:hypothetical protein
MNKTALQALSAVILLAGASPASAQTAGSPSPLVDAIYGAGIGGGIGAAVDGKKGAQKGAVVGGVLGLAGGMPVQYPYQTQQQPANPLYQGIVGAGVGGGIGAAIDGRKGARTGAIVGGAAGLVQGAAQQQQQQRYYEPRYPQRQYGYNPPAPRYYQPEPRYVTRTTYVAAPSQFVANVQRALVNLGYAPGGVDGRMGPATSAAIRSYQHDYRLQITGSPSAELLAHMRRNGG